MTETEPGQAHIINNEGVEIAYYSAGEGPLLVLCHGFPGLAYSWRHQLTALAAAGFHAVAPDMRGYGKSGQPAAVAEYSLDHIRSDMLALLDHLQAERAIFVGHDFGTPVVWHLALECPDRVAGVAALSVPYDFDYYGRRGVGHRGEPELNMLPSEQFAAYAQDAFLHAHYFQQPGPADAELNANTATFLRRIYWALSGEGDLLAAFASAAPGAAYLDVLPEPARPLPWPWLDAHSLQHYVSTFETSGFRGPLNWYRVADINWQLNRRYLGQKIDCPALFIAGEKDPVMMMSGPESLTFMRSMVPLLAEEVTVPQAGHWVQQEAPGRVNQCLLAFARDIYSPLPKVKA